MIKELCIAPGNRGKLDEIRAILGDSTINIHNISDFTNERAAETGSIFVEKPIIKARFAAQLSKLPNKCQMIQDYV